LQLERQPRTCRVAIVIDVDAGDDYLWIWAGARSADLVMELRRRGIEAEPVRVHIDGYLNP
jgi:hypothetical protein